MAEENAFANWLKTRMFDDDVTAADVARATGIDPSLISKWRRGEALPSLANLKRLAPAFGVSYLDLARLAGHIESAADGAPVGERVRHRLVADLERMLAEESPVPQDERLLLETLIDRVIEPYRRHFRRRRAG